MECPVRATGARLNIDCAQWAHKQQAPIKTIVHENDKTTLQEEHSSLPSRRGATQRHGPRAEANRAMGEVTPVVRAKALGSGANGQKQFEKDQLKDSVSFFGDKQRNHNRTENASYSKHSRQNTAAPGGRRTASRPGRQPQSAKNRVTHRQHAAQFQTHVHARTSRERSKRMNVATTASYVRIRQRPMVSAQGVRTTGADRAAEGGHQSARKDGKLRPLFSKEGCTG
jgi:hypothetical protein